MAGPRRQGSVLRKTLRALALALAVLAGNLSQSGCAHEEVKLLRADPGFTAEALRVGGVAVLGVTKVEEVAQVRKPLTQSLERILREERGELPVIGAAWAESILGERPLRLLLNAYQAAGVLETDALEEVSAGLKGAARYAVLARVESDAVRYSTRDVSPADTGLYGVVSSVRITGRDARIAIQVYDLVERRLVSSAKYVSSAESTGVDPRSRISADSRFPRTYPPPDQPQGGITIGAGERREPQDEGYAEPPPLVRSVVEGFRNFARALPRPPPTR